VSVILERDLFTVRASSSDSFSINANIYYYAVLFVTFIDRRYGQFWAVFYALPVAPTQELWALDQLAKFVADHAEHEKQNTEDKNHDQSARLRHKPWIRVGLLLKLPKINQLIFTFR